MASVASSQNRVTRIFNVCLSGEIRLLRQCKREVGLNLLERDNVRIASLVVLICVSMVRHHYTILAALDLQIQLCTS